MKDIKILIRQMQIAATCIFIVALVSISMNVVLAVQWSNTAKNGAPHTCTWGNCPYKGVAYAGRDSAVTTMYGDSLRYSDAYCIDMLHIEHPTLDYDQLDSLLFTTKK